MLWIFSRIFFIHSWMNALTRNRRLRRIDSKNIYSHCLHLRKAEYAKSIDSETVFGAWGSCVFHISVNRWFSKNIINSNTDFQSWWSLYIWKLGATQSFYFYSFDYIAYSLNISKNVRAFFSSIFTSLAWIYTLAHW